MYGLRPPAAPAGAVSAGQGAGGDPLRRGGPPGLQGLPGPAPPSLLSLQLNTTIRENHPLHKGEHPGIGAESSQTGPREPDTD